MVVHSDLPPSRIPDSLLEHLQEVERQRGRYYYLAPAELKERLQEAGFSHMAAPPFSYIAPDIHHRRNSQNIKELWYGYKDEIITEKILLHLARNFPDYAYIETIGTSLQGRPIYALKISDNPGMEEDEPSFLFNGAHHGNEPLSTDYVLDAAMTLLAATIADMDLKRALQLIPDPGIHKMARANKTEFLHAIKKTETWFVPIVNPDGVHYYWNNNALSGRKNLRNTDGRRGYTPSEGVDLNRNYPFFWDSGRIRASSDDPLSVFYRGQSPASEPETKAMMRLAHEQRFVFALSYHSFATKVLVPYTADGAANPFPSASWRLGDRLAKQGESHRPHKRYRAARNIYSVDGTDQDYLHHAYGTQAFIVEGSYHTPRYDENGRKSILGMRPLSLHVYELYSKGPSLMVKTQDMNGSPLQAKVELPDIVFMEDESFTTHPANGRFDYLLPGPGSFRVRVERKGRGKVEKVVECTSGICPVLFRLPR